VVAVETDGTISNVFVLPYGTSIAFGARIVLPNGGIVQQSCRLWFTGCSRAPRLGFAFWPNPMTSFGGFSIPSASTIKVGSLVCAFHCCKLCFVILSPGCALFLVCEEWIAFTAGVGGAAMASRFRSKIPLSQSFVRNHQYFRRNCTCDFSPNKFIFLDLPAIIK
jgi:hypothetical protein